MNCPRCGKETEGSYSEGGILWTLCEDCMNEDKKKFNEDKVYTGRRKNVVSVDGNVRISRKGI